MIMATVNYMPLIYQKSHKGIKLLKEEMEWIASIYRQNSVCGSPFENVHSSLTLLS